MDGWMDKWNRGWDKQVLAVQDTLINVTPKMSPLGSFTKASMEITSASPGTHKDVGRNKCMCSTYIHVV